MILDEFLVNLGFEVNTEKLAEFNAKAAELKESIIKIGAVAAGAAIGLGLLAIGVAESMGEIYKFAELNEISAKSLAALGKIATENGSSMDGMKSSVQGLNRVIGEAALGVGRGAMLFEKMGLKAKDNTGKVKGFDTMLSEISDKMKGLGRQEQIALASKLGIDPTLVQLLGKGSANLKSLREEAEALNPLTEKQYQQAEEVNKLYVKAKGSIGVFTKLIGASLLPLTKEVLETFLKWFKASRSATSGAVITAIGVLTTALGTLWAWTVRVINVGQALYKWLASIPGVTYAVATALFVLASMKTYETMTQLVGAIRAVRIGMMALGATISPVAIIVGGLILAIGLLIDDFVNFEEGNESLIGNLAKKFPIILDVIHMIEDGVKTFMAFWMAEWEQLKGPLGDLASSLGNLVKELITDLWPVIKMIFTGWAYLFAAIAPWIIQIVSWIAQDLVAAIKGWVMIITLAVDYITEQFHDLAEAVTIIWGGIGAAIKAVFDMVMVPINWVMDMIHKAQADVTDFIEVVVGAIDKVKSLLHLNSEADKANPIVEKARAAAAQAPVAQPVPDPNNTPTTASGPRVANTAPDVPAYSLYGAGATANYMNPIGAPSEVTKGANVSTTTTNSTSISGVTITVNSPDAAKAGESVQERLTQMNQTSIRNGQSKVAL